MEPLLVFLLGLGFTLAITPVVRAVARATGRVAHPTTDRWHKQPTALFGGVGMYAGFLAGAVAFLWLTQRSAPGGAVLPTPAIGIVLAGTVMFVTGFIDDIHKLRPTSKLVLQALAGVVLVTVGVQYALTPWAPVNVVVTLLWFIALTNALNLLDNMDGVTTAVTGVSALFLAVLFGVAGEWVFVALALALAGSALGFLPYNMRPASIFMGDTGSLFHGAMLAGLGASYTMVAPPSSAAAFVPLLIVIVPILDTGLVTLTRTLAGRPITQGGQDHIAHRLVRMGFRESRAAILLSTVAAGGGVFALLLALDPGPLSVWLAAFYVLALVVCGAYLSQMYSYPEEAVRSLRRGRIVFAELLYRRRLLEVLLDLVVFAVAYTGAYLLRFDGAPPPNQALLLERTLALAVGCKSVAFLLCGVYRGVWGQASIPDLHRLARGTLLGSALTVAAIVFLFRDAEFARGILVLDGILVGLLVIVLRASFRSLDTVRYALNGAGAPTLVYGAGKAGEVVLRELFSNPKPQLHPVGFIDDEPTMEGRTVLGLPVLGSGVDLPALLTAHGAEAVVISTGKLPTEQLRRVVDTCRTRGVEVMQLRLEIEPVVPHDVRVAKQGVAALGSRERSLLFEISTSGR